MVDKSEAALDRVFHALASQARRDILRRTAARPCTVTELAQHFDMSLAAVAKHVRVLDDAKLLVEKRQGRLHWRRLNGEALRPARDVIEQLRAFWEAQLDGLHEYLMSTRVTPAAKPGVRRTPIKPRQKG